jgi:hypothetical protein
VEIRIRGSCTGAEVAFFVDGSAKGFIVGAKVGSLIGAEGSPGGSLVGAEVIGAKVGSLIGAEWSPGGSLVGAEVSSLVRAFSVGGGSGGSGLAPVGTVIISFASPFI